MLVARELTAWDWRWRAPFDLELSQQIRSAATDLATCGFTQQAEIMSHLLDHACRYASLGGLIESLAEEHDAKRRHELIERAADRRLNGIPSYLQTAMDKKIEEVAVDDAERRALSALRRDRSGQPWREPHTGALQLVFGTRLPNLLEVGRRLRPASGIDVDLGRALRPKDLQETIDSFLSSHPALDPLVPRFSVRIAQATGFGAYWPQELTGASEDKLEVWANADSLRPVALRQTLAHEIAGHGVYYGLLRRKQPSFVDHGALALVEGWATFAEWMLPGMSGPGGARMAWLDLVGAAEDTVRDEIPRIVRAQGYSMQQAESALLMWTQLPAYQLSYQLGALWFLDRASSFAEGLEVLEAIATKPVGDFLATY